MIVVVNSVLVTTSISSVSAVTGKISVRLSSTGKMITGAGVVVVSLTLDVVNDLFVVLMVVVVVVVIVVVVMVVEDVDCEVEVVSVVEAVAVFPVEASVVCVVSVSRIVPSVTISF